MGKFKTSCGLAALMLVLAAPCAHAAGASRTWVSGMGDDSFPCSRTAPCKTFASAITKTAVGGEISVLDPGGYGAVTITQSITINGTSGAGYGSIAAAGVTGITINITDPADTKRTVRLNWLDINGYGSGLQGIKISNSNLAGVSVVIENTTIDGFTGRGITDERMFGGKLVVANTTVRHTADSAIRIAGMGVSALLSNVRVHNSATAGLTANSGAKVMVSNSVFSGSTIGLDIEQAGTEATVDGSTVSGNTTGLFTTGGAALRLSNSNVAHNAAGVSGTVESFSNNRFVGNGLGGTVTPIGAPTSATGMQ